MKQVLWSSIGILLFAASGYLVMSLFHDRENHAGEVVRYRVGALIGVPARKAEVSGDPNEGVPGAPGRLYEGGAPGFKMLSRVKNQWSAANRGAKNTVAVVVGAGAAKGSTGTGRFQIVRTVIPGQQRMNIVDIPTAGALRITGAPLGTEGEETARFAILRFTSQDGLEGILDLADDKVTLRGGK